MIATLNRLSARIEERLDEELDVAGFARDEGTTEYHLRRMFSALAGMPLSEYVRRRRMTVAAGDVVAGEDLLGVAVRYGYGSSDAFGRAFRAVHGAGPSDVRRDGGPLRSQPQLRFRLTVEGTTSMDARITERPAFRLIGHATRVPLIHRGANPHIEQHIASIPMQEHLRLKELADTEPAGLLQVTSEQDDVTEGSMLTYLHGVAVADGSAVPDDLDVIVAPAGSWVVFRTLGPHPEALQEAWAATATEWFPSNPWRLRPGPSIVAILERADDFRTATCELWMPVERAWSSRHTGNSRGIHTDMGSSTPVGGQVAVGALRSTSASGGCRSAGHRPHRDHDSGGARGPHSPGPIDTHPSDRSDPGSTSAGRGAQEFARPSP